MLTDYVIREWKEDYCPPTLPSTAGRGQETSIITNDGLNLAQYYMQAPLQHLTAKSSW